MSDAAAVAQASSSEFPKRSYAAAVGPAPSDGTVRMETEEDPTVTVKQPAKPMEPNLMNPVVMVKKLKNMEPAMVDTIVKEMKKLKAMEPTLIDIEGDDDTTIRLRFEVLLSPEMTIPDSRLVICFGPPLSDWNTECVVMSPKSDKVPGNYVLMAGVLDFPRRLVGKTIPYKYVVVGDDRPPEWEHIFLAPDTEAIVNRCLIVPDKGSQFSKFDDVIFSKTSNKFKGWAVATKLMLPTWKNFTSPDFSLASVLERFEQVLAAHAKRRICVGKYYLSFAYKSPGDMVKKQAENWYLEDCLKQLKVCLDNNNGDMVVLLRLATYICLIRKSSFVAYQFNEELYQLMFRAFNGCSQLLWDDASSLMLSMDRELQDKACEALKLLVTNFVDRKLYEYVEGKDSGNWIYVVPFIHRWDRSNRNDQDWLKLDKWKENLSFRYYLSF